MSSRGNLRIFLVFDLIFLGSAVGGASGARDLFDGIHRATIEYKVGELGHEGLELVLDLVPASGSSPT